MAVPVLLLLIVFAAVSGARAQEATPAAPIQPHTHDTNNQPTTTGWQWSAEATTFVGYNYQYRKFTDFDDVESQNWLMTSAARPLGASRLRLLAMFSFEPFTLHNIGSSQVFQTGETYNSAPLIDYQHPHDLFMNIGGTVSRAYGATNLTVDAYLVGPAPLGPPVFMHRPSAAENPQAPLGHHLLDSTHITPGVITAGIGRRAWRAEAGVFRGREPDEDRLDLDVGALDSFGGRLSWTRGSWYAQVSGAALTRPEPLSPYDSDRLSASLSYFSGNERRSLAWLAAFGQNREVHGNFETYLLEATRKIAGHNLYTRGEWVAKDILDAGFHPGFAHIHRQSPVGVLTLGYSRDLFPQQSALSPEGRSWGSLAIGGDVTGYIVPDNLKDSYGSPLSFHLYVRYRGRAGSPELHIH